MTIEELKQQLEEAWQVENAARQARLRVEMELATARGDEFDARWTKALLDGDSAAAHQCHAESSARRVLAGRATLDDFERSIRDDIAAEVERMRAQH